MVKLNIYSIIRKNTGIRIVINLVIFTVFLYFVHLTAENTY